MFDPFLCRDLYSNNEYDCKYNDRKDGEGDSCDPCYVCEGYDLYFSKNKCKNDTINKKSS